jgi:cyclase
MRMRALVRALLILLLSASLAFAQAGQGPFGSSYTITTLAPGVHTLTWTIPPGSPAIGNSTFIVGDSDVVVVDSGFTLKAGEAIIDGLRALTDKPVSMVINTHWHGDHIFGNQAFRKAFPSARFVAHPATRDGIITGEIDYRAANRPKTIARRDELRAQATRTDNENRELSQTEWQVEAWDGDYVLPDLLVEDRLTIVQGGRRLEVRHLGLANTKGDLIVHLPAERVAINGDMAITPMQFAFFSSPRRWVETLGRLASLEADVFVPGHGPVQRDKRFIADLQAMLRSLVEQVDAGMKAGQDLEELKASVKIAVPAGSVYEKASAAALDRLFRIPAIESAVREKG